jgi:hypothetical protein
MTKLLCALLDMFSKSNRLPSQGVTEHDEFLAFAEVESQRTLDDLKAAFAGHFERAVKALTLLTGGAGAVVAYTVNHWTTLEVPAKWALLALALGWSGIAAFLAMWGMRSRALRSGPDLMGIATVYAEHSGGIDQPRPRDQVMRAMQVLRMAELNRRHLQTEAYANAISEQTIDLRRAVILATLSPALAIAVWALAMQMA